MVSAWGLREALPLWEGMAGSHKAVSWAWHQLEGALSGYAQTGQSRRDWSVCPRGSGGTGTVCPRGLGGIGTVCPRGCGGTGTVCLRGPGGIGTVSKGLQEGLGQCPRGRRGAGTVSKGSGRDRNSVRGAWAQQPLGRRTQHRARNT